MAVQPKSSHRASNRLLLLFVALCPVWATYTCSARTIKIGVPLALTGLTSRLGVSARNGIELAAEEINSAGGIKGRQLELLIMDDGDDPQKAVAADRALHAAGAIALLGHMSSKSGQLAAGLASELQIPLLSPTISSTDHSGKDDWFFRIIGANDKQGTALAEWALSQGWTRAAGGWEQSNQSYTRAVWTGFETSFVEGRGKMAPGLSFVSSQETSYDKLVEEWLKTEPDCLLVAGSSYDAANIAQELARHGVSLPILVSMWARTDDLIVFGGKTVEGIVAAAGLDPEMINPQMDRFRDAFKKRYGEAPDFGAVYGYEATMVLAAALKSAKQLNGPGIREALRRLEPVAGLQGAIEMDQYGDSNRPYYLYQIRDGRFYRME
ncbi:MAG: ABC transporter substrate-binding protein [Spirochaetes bacterium]|nr:ABC transporter substrate-binding protein [Spirochaetota bacterium]MBU0955780.1 ABC transporter substrate-binding protein [Spirochaetota bacterium]